MAWMRYGGEILQYCEARSRQLRAADLVTSIQNVSLF